MGKIKMIMICLLLTSFACGCKKNNNPKAQDNIGQEKFKELIEYAEHLSIKAYADYYIVELSNTWMTEDTTRIILEKKHSKSKMYMQQSETAISVKVPVNSIAATATTQLAMIHELGAIDQLKGLSGTKYVYNQDVRNRIEDEFIKEIGDPSGGTNIETLIALDPELTLVYGIDENDVPSLQKLKDAGLQTLMFAEFTETSPLGRAEWIKLIGVLVGQEQKAMEYFASIEQEYLDLQQLAKNSINRKSTFTGMSWKDSWVVPGGKSYVGEFLNDAGCEYLWAKTDEKGSIHLSFESAYEKAIIADVWLNPGMAQSISDISKRNDLYATFKSVQNKEVFNNTKRISENGGYDFWESGVINPQLVLADLIKIFHSDLLPEHDLYYYEKLK